MPSSLHKRLTRQLSSGRAPPSLQDVPSHIAGPRFPTPTPSNEDADADDDSSSSSSSLSECPSHDEDEEGTPSVTSGPRNKASSPNAGPSAIERSLSPEDTRIDGRKYWTKAEDAVLIAAVGQHGYNWAKVKKKLDAANGPPRTKSAIKQRYKNLALRSAQKRQASTALAGPLAAVYTTAPPPLKRVRRALAAVPTDLHWNPVSGQAWSQEEEAKLADIGQKCKRPKGIYRRWLKVFPSSTRSESAVLGKWHVMVKKKQQQQQQEEEEEGVPRRRSGRPRGAGSASLLTPLAIKTEEQQASTVAAAEDDVVDYQARPESPLDEKPPSLLADYVVTMTDDGFLIQNLPPLHHLLILSPIKCRVVRPGQLSTRQQQAAPFVFKGGLDGSIEGLKVPQGTVRSTSMQMQQALGHGQGQKRRCVESKWTAVDGFTVLFESYGGLRGDGGAGVAERGGMREVWAPLSRRAYC